MKPSQTISRLVTSWLLRIPFVFLPIVAVSCQSTQPKLSIGESAVLCVMRAEENGAINILPTEILIDGRPVGAILGGNSRDIAVTAGKHQVTVRSHDPYDPKSKPTSWRSNRVTVIVAAGQIFTIYLEPRSKDSTYSRGWFLRPQF